MTLPAGNYEYPFEYHLPGDTAESVEGIPEASITYRLKATVGRGKFAYDLHAHKHIRVIRTLEPGALEILHAMSVENIWPNKVEYSIVIPQKAVVFGGLVTLDMRFTPLLKGLELGDITAKMIEIREVMFRPQQGTSTMREHRTERDVATWKFDVDRTEHWQDVIEETGQEGWILSKQLNLPKKLRQCIQDLNHNGIKVRHKIKLTVALKNPDGHVSELRATLPVSIFISPNIPFDENGALLAQGPNEVATALGQAAVAPPGYGEHILDQLFEDVDPTGFMTPGMQTPAVQSGISSPFYSHSRSGSTENLAAATTAPFTASALSSRLATVSLEPSQRNRSYNSLHSAHGHDSPNSHQQSGSNDLTRSNSEEDGSSRHSDDHIQLDTEEFAQLNRVPSYATAVRTPARNLPSTSTLVPDYETALSAPRTPPTMDFPHEILSTISETGAEEEQTTRPAALSMVRSHSDSGMARRLQAMRVQDQAV